MAYSMTYNSLLVDLRNYLERGYSKDTDPVVFDQLPNFITFAERRISREIKVQGFIRVVNTTLSIGDPVYEKPDRWRGTISMNVEGNPLYSRSYEFCVAYWPDRSEKGSPEYFSDYDYKHWLIVPTPVSAKKIEILYYEQPQFIGPEIQTNWITEYAPDLLLYASLLEATPFLKNDERIAVWQGMYDRAAKALDEEDISRILDRTAHRGDT